MLCIIGVKLKTFGKLSDLNFYVIVSYCDIEFSLINNYMSFPRMLFLIIAVITLLGRF